MSPSSNLDPFGRPLSGFRRIGLEAAPIAADLGGLLDPDPNTTATTDIEVVSNWQRDALARLDEAAARCPVDAARSRGIGLHNDRSLRFALACDVDADRRWRAIVSRAFARADAVAWCDAEGKSDGRYLAETAEKISRCRTLLRDLTFDTRIHDTIVRHRAGNDALGDWVADLNKAAETLEQCETWARAVAANINRIGRRRVIARSHFVLRLAAAYAVLTGEEPQFDGGNDEDAHDDHGERKRLENRRWHELIKAALDVTGITGDGRVNSILSHAAGIADGTYVDRIRGLAAQEPRDLGSIEVGSWPATGLEVDVGLNVRSPPETRDEAYEAPGIQFIGLGGISRSGK